ncbi:hypothetical protein ACIRRH_19010 [Kitasatospora sp. NPDC101235]|uniref:hypothetical protein n=1 Tax=Kitasatospora sp. NPDC101235 TaxID=3364101 RepID=UPI00381B0F6E
MTRTLAAVALGAAAWLGGVAPAGASVFDGATVTNSGNGGGGHSCVQTTAWGDAWCPGKPLS